MQLVLASKLWATITATHCILFIVFYYYYDVVRSGPGNVVAAIATSPPTLPVLGRFMADVPYAHASRLQAIAPFLVQAHNGAAVPFLLVGLLQCTKCSDIELQSSEATQRWRDCLQQPQASLPVCAPCLCVFKM